MRKSDDGGHLAAPTGKGPIGALGPFWDEKFRGHLSALKGTKTSLIGIKYSLSKDKMAPDYIILWIKIKKKSFLKSQPRLKTTYSKISFVTTVRRTRETSIV